MGLRFPKNGGLRGSKPFTRPYNEIASLLLKGAIQANTRSKRSKVIIGISWTLVSALAWMAGREVLRSYSMSGIGEIAQSALSLLIPSAIIGAILGVAGAIIFRPFIISPFLWFLVTSISFPAFLVSGFLLNVAQLLRLLSAMDMILQAEGGGAFICPSPLQYLPLTGLLLGVVQLPILHQDLRRSLTQPLLWVFGSMLAYAIGWIVSVNVDPSNNVVSIAEGVIMGVLSGAFLAGIMLILSREISVSTQEGLIGSGQNNSD